MKKLLTLVLGLSLLAGPAFAQAVGQLQSGQVWGNDTAAARSARGTTVGAILDRQLTCSAQGDIIFRGSTAWSCLAPGTSGLPLLSGGAGANLAYGQIANAALVNPTVTVNGTTCTLGSTCTPNTIASLTVTGSFTATGLVPYAAMASAAIATQAQYFSGAANVLVPASQIYQAEVAVTFGATTSFDFNTFINASVTLTANITTQTLSNVTAGKAGTIAFIQDATGSRTTVWNSVFKFAGGTTPALTTTANAVDILNYSCRSATFCVASLTKDVR